MRFHREQFLCSLSGGIRPKTNPAWAGIADELRSVGGNRQFPSSGLKLVGSSLFLQAATAANGDASRKVAGHNYV